MEIAIGTNKITGQDVVIDDARHIYIEGMSGVGKSTALVNLFIRHIRQGHGGVFVDPHGDAADQIARLIPKSRMRDFIWIDPNAPFVPGLNIFAYRDPMERELGVESFLTIMKALAGSAWGDETARILTNAADAVVSRFERPTAVHVFRFLVDDRFREKMLAQETQPLLQLFHRQYDEKLRSPEQMSRFSPPINKVGKLMRPAILPVIGQQKSLDFLEIMNDSRIVVCRLSKGRLGEEISQVLGSLVVSMVSISALKREKQRRRSPFMMVVDEAGSFSHGGRFGSLLAESRKYGISLVLASQSAAQLPFLADVFANCPTQIAYQASGDDAMNFARNWGHETMAQAVVSLPRFECYVRTFIGDSPTVVRTIAQPAIERQGNEANVTALIKQSLERWGTKRREVEARIGRFLASG